jgi:hypothetical protein
VFESAQVLAREIADLLHGFRVEAEGRYAAVVEPKGILFEDAEEAEGGWMLRRFLDQHAAALFGIPQALAADGPSQDVFEDWTEDEFLLAFVNGRVALVVACPSAEAARQRADAPVRALVDRLLRYDERWRVDARGRGLFLGRPRLDLVVIGKVSP